VLRDEIIDQLSKLELAKYRFTARVQDRLTLPKFKGSAFRGGFGHAFRRVTCSFKGRSSCEGCLLRESCLYSYVFETPMPEGAEIFTKNPYAPHPFVIEPPLEERESYEPGDQLSFNLVLIGRAIQYFPYFLVGIEELGKMGLGERTPPGRRGRYRLEEVTSVGLSLEGEGAEVEVEVKVKVYSAREGRILSEGLVVNGGDLILMSALGEQSLDPKRVRVTFLTPARFHHQPGRKGPKGSSREPEWYVGQPGSPIPRLEFHILLEALLRRLSLLLYFHCGQRLQLDFTELLERAQEVTIEEDQLQWTELARYSSRQKRWIKLGGLTGQISFAGRLGPFLPYLLLGEQIHVGKGTAFGLGQMKLEFNSKEKEAKT